MRLVVPGTESGCEPVGAHGRIYQIKAPHPPVGDRRYRIILPIGRCLREVHRILETEQPEILEVSDKYTLPYISGMLRKRLLNGVTRPTEVATSHERMDVNVSAYLIRGAPGKWLSRFYLHFLYVPMFDHHIANSEYTAAELVPAARGLTTPRGIWVCPMGLDVGFFDSRTRRPHPGKRLLYAGRLAVEKNTHLLVDALLRLPNDYVLVIAGAGPQRDWFVNQAATRAYGRIVMKEHFASREEFAQELADADVFVHPNPHEPFGITPLEAMACGVPVVAPCAGGVLSYANADNAWLSEPTTDAFAAAIEGVFADAAERERRVACARLTALRHDWTVIAQRYFDLLDTLHRGRK
jgi:glycosyltransferase involved in cell wall biosynthesis